MTLHNEWMHFKKTCLTGQSRESIASARRIFYAGASAFYILERDSGSDRRFASLLKELDNFKAAAIAAARAPSK